MRQKHRANAGSAEQAVRDIRRATRKQYLAEEKIRIVLEGVNKLRRRLHPAHVRFGALLSAALLEGPR